MFITEMQRLGEIVLKIMQQLTIEETVFQLFQ